MTTLPVAAQASPKGEGRSHLFAEPCRRPPSHLREGFGRGACRTLLLGLCLLFAATVPALAREEITSFDSNTALRTDGSVDVTETIDVNAEGGQIRHGIFRDIFTVLRNTDGSKFYSTLKVLDVERDGHAEPYSTESIPNGERIRIGSADSIVSRGAHEYLIRYSMTRMARFFPDHDELYWNATGNYWVFPIVKTTATLTLPKGAVISRLAAYTGAPGSTATDATQERNADNVASFATTRELAPGEGLTVAAAFQKGIVQPPAGAAQGLNWLSDHRDAVVPPIALILVLAFNFAIWNRVGRDPKRGTIIPLFHPPEGMSPAMTQWIQRMGFKGSGWNAFTSAIFDLGVKGLVAVDNSDKKLKVTATGAAPKAPLSADEQVLFDYFSAQGTVTIDKSTGPTIDSKRKAMLSAITGPNGGKYFHNNIGFIVLSLALAAICLGLMVFFDVLDLGWLIGGAIAAVVLGVFTLVARNGLGAGRSAFGMIIMGFWALVFGVNALVALGGLLTASPTISGPAIAAVSIIAITMLFVFLMRAPTPDGRKLMDQIDGFVMYLRTAEKNRLNLENEPPLTVSRFEAILPFAIALGVERPWTDKFNAALAANAVPDAPNGYYAPIWYSGREFSSRDLSSNIAAISTAMTAAMAAAVPSSSSSSGFSGGSSGGGGGGGGGGGW